MNIIELISTSPTRPGVAYTTRDCSPRSNSLCSSCIQNICMYICLFFFCDDFNANNECSTCVYGRWLLKMNKVRNVKKMHVHSPCAAGNSSAWRGVFCRRRSTGNVFGPLSAFMKNEYTTAKEKTEWFMFDENQRGDDDDDGIRQWALIILGMFFWWVKNILDEAFLHQHDMPL